MPYPRPTLDELRQEVASAIQSRIPGVDALLRFSPLRIIGDALAGLVNGLYGYLDWIAKQTTPFSATDEYLEGWAARAGITRKPAVAATGTISLAATDGALVPAGTVLARSDGAQFVTTSEAVASGGQIVLNFRAVDRGAGGNALAGTLLSLGIGISGVQASGTTVDPVAGGADVEDDDSLRSRMLAAYAEPPQGGSISDYRQWSLAVPGVTRAWINPQAMGPGTIVIFFMLDDANSGTGGFPQGANGVAADESRDTAATGDQLNLANAIYLKQSATALVYAVAPTANLIDLSLSGLSASDSDTRAAIAAAIGTALVENAQPGGRTNLDIILKAIGDVPGTSGFLVSAISCSAGSIVDGAVGNILSDAGALPVLGTVSYL